MSTAKALGVWGQMCLGTQCIGHPWGESEKHHLGKNWFWYHQLGRA